VGEKAGGFMSIGMMLEPKINKDKQEVELLLSTNTGMKGYFFLAKGQRAIDMLNDNRRFVPFEDISGNIRLINKENIISVRPTGVTAATIESGEN
jgi:hypothetical protein